LSGTGSITGVVLLRSRSNASGISSITATATSNNGFGIYTALANVTSNAAINSPANLSAAAVVTPNAVQNATSTLSGISTITTLSFSTIAASGTVTAAPALAVTSTSTLSAGTGFSAVGQQFYGAIAYMTTIVQLWTLPPIVVAYGSSAVSATGAIAARPAISSYPVSTGTGIVSAQPYVIQRSKVLASGIGQSVLPAIIPAHPMTKRGRGRMTAIPYVTPAPIALIRGAGILLPKDFFLSKSQLALAWNTRSKVSPTITPYWMTIARVITKQGFSWNIVKTPTAKLQGTGNVAARFAPQATLRGTGTAKPVLTHITKLVGISWNTRQKVTSSLAVSWNTAGHIKTSKRMTWNTIVHIDPGVHFTWNTNALAVTSQQELSWNNLIKITTSQSCHWDTHGLIKTSKPALWNTKKTINSTKAISWNTRVKVSPLLHISYNTTGRLRSSQAFKWSLVETALLAGTSHIKLAEHLSVTKAIHWNTCERIHSPQAVSWNDLYRIGKFGRFTWNLQGHYRILCRVLWNTRIGPNISQLPVFWQIYQPDQDHGVLLPPSTISGAAVLAGQSTMLAGPIATISAAGNLIVRNTYSPQTILQARGYSIPVGAATTAIGPVPNVGTTAGQDNVPQANNFTFTVPAGVLVDDVMITVVSCITYTSSSPAIATPTSGSGAWNQIATLADSGPSGGVNEYGTAWYKVATAADPGSTFSINFSGTQGVTNAFYWAAALESYSSVVVPNPVDVVAIPNATTGTSVTLPTVTTNQNSDWAVYLVASLGVVHTGIAGATLRQYIHSGSTTSAEIWDSNASVGAAGTVIGGQTISSGGSDWYAAFTLGLIPKLVTLVGPVYDSNVTTDNTGSGVWVNTGNATGLPDGNNTSWIIT
jgi:hypothetical protein